MHNSLTQDQFISKSIKKHGYQYDYSQVKYINTATKIRILCKLHGKFLQLAGNHLSGHGCPECGNISTKNKRADTKEIFIKKAKKIHKDKYDYSSVIYKNSKTYIIIICKKCKQEFYQKPNSHLSGCGCKKCSNEKTHNNQRKSLEEFICQAKIIHNNKYLYDQVVYKNTRDKIKIFCKIHNSFFLQSPSKHLSGQHGCKLCSNRESNGEKKIRLWLENNSIFYEQEKSFSTCRRNNSSIMRFDFYLPDYNLLIEYDGKQHYKQGDIWNKNKYSEFEKIKLRDEFKNKWAKDNGYNLLRIPYFKFKDIDSILNFNIRGVSHDN